MLEPLPRELSDSVAQLVAIEMRKRETSVKPSETSQLDMAQLAPDSQLHRSVDRSATTITGGDGSRLPTVRELEGARYQGRKIAETANKLHG